MTDTAPQRFSSRWALVISVLGIAVGTGNIWRFPRIAASNAGPDGAGAFLVAWVVFLLAWSLPLIVAEYALGQRGRAGVVGTFARLAGGRFAWAGAFVAFVATAIMCYYSVVAGWCAYYVATSVGAPAPPSSEAALAAWQAFQGSPWPVLGHALMMGLGVAACWRGVRSIERVNGVLVPALLVVVLVAVVRAVTLPGAGAGLAFLFTPDWSTLAEPRVWLEALTQNAWDTGAGWGLILTYAAYMRREDGVVRNAVLTGVGNNTVSILAAVMMFGIAFAILGGGGQSGAEILDVMRSGGERGTGMTFVWVPLLFAQMPLGKPLLVLFFVALSFAALSSLISMIELAARVAVDFGVRRARALWGVGLVGFAAGLPSALSGAFFDNQDFVWGVALMLSGALVALAVVRHGPARLRAAVATPADWRLPAVWDAWIRVGIPVQAAVLLGWWLYRATTSDFAEHWWNPLEPFSAASCLLQWAVVLAVLVGLNGWMVRRLEAAPAEDEDEDA